jgi:hypothetical protein
MSTYEANRYNFSGANVTGIPTSAITSGTFADARLSSSSITQHVDLTALSASNLTSGTVPDARFPATLPTASGANLTSIATTTTTGTWSVDMTWGSYTWSMARYQKIGNMCWCVAYGQWTDHEGEGTGSGADAGDFITGLPFTSANVGGTFVSGGRFNVAYYNGVVKVDANSTTARVGREGYMSSYTTFGSGDGKHKTRSNHIYPQYTSSDKRYVYIDFWYFTA